jgi:hypothetical protein
MPKKVSRKANALKKDQWMDSISSSANASAAITDLDNLIAKMMVSAPFYPDSKNFSIPIIEKLRETRDFATHYQKQFIEEKKPDLDDYAGVVEEYDCLIHKKGVSESKVHNFFVAHSNVLDPKIVKLYSKKSFGGEKFPDFIARLSIEKYILIEIEKPSDSIYRKSGDPSPEFSHAEQQIRNYLHWANEDKEWLRKRDLPKISAENMKGLIIIGMRSSMDSKDTEKLEQHNFSVRATHEIKTFDDILMENRQFLENLRKISGKV